MRYGLGGNAELLHSVESRHIAIAAHQCVHGGTQEAPLTLSVPSF